MKKGSRESYHYCAQKVQTVLDSSPHKRQQGGCSPNCQPSARRRADFGTRTFPARLWQPFSHSTLHKVRLYQTFFILYHIFGGLSRGKAEKHSSFLIINHFSRSQLSPRNRKNLCQSIKFNISYRTRFIFNTRYRTSANVHTEKLEFYRQLLLTHPRRLSVFSDYITYQILSLSVNNSCHVSSPIQYFVSWQDIFANLVLT